MPDELIPAEPVPSPDEITPREIVVEQANVGRPTKYTPGVVARLIQALEMGATYDHACNFAGIHYDTFREWIKDKSEFSEEVKKAEGRAVVGWLAKIEQAANEGSWQAAAWKLERRYPHLYGRMVTEIQQAGPGSWKEFMESLDADNE
jgi:hypothetical protein